MPRIPVLKRSWWLVLARLEPDLCLRDPGFPSLASSIARVTLEAVILACRFAPASRISTVTQISPLIYLPPVAGT